MKIYEVTTTDIFLRLKKRSFRSEFCALKFIIKTKRKFLHSMVSITLEIFKIPISAKKAKADL